MMAGFKTTYISRYQCVRGTGGIEHIVFLNKTTADMVDVWHICILLQHYLAIYTTPLSMVHGAGWVRAERISGLLQI